MSLKQVMQGEPVLYAKFIEPIAVPKLRAAQKGSNQYSQIDLTSHKYKGEVAMDRVSEGIRVRVKNSSAVVVVPWTNVSCYSAVSDSIWAEDQESQDKITAEADRQVELEAQRRLAGVTA